MTATKHPQLPQGWNASEKRCICATKNYGFAVPYRPRCPVHDEPRKKP